MGDRRDHFESQKDLWDIFLVVIEERKKREIDPTLTMLRECVLENEKDNKTPDDVKNRIHNTLEFMELLTGWYDQMKRLPQPTLVKMMKLGAKIQSLIGAKN